MTPLHGLLLVKKPPHATSHDIVSFARRALQTKAIGHTGTLDPLASGLMVLVIGEATKLSDYILNGDKAYRVKVKLGVTTDSMDITGQILSEQNVNLDSLQIKNAAEALVGDYEWEVPLFSAAKQNGIKMYDYAHKGEKPQFIPKKSMSFWQLKTLNIEQNFYEGHVHCSKGSYIRVWAQKLGEALSCGGAVAELDRTMSAPYKVESAISLETLVKDYQEQTEAWRRAFIAISDTLPGWKTITVRGKDERLIYNGQISYDLERRLVTEEKEAYSSQKVVGVKVLSADTGQILAILEAQPQRGLKIRRVFRV